MQVRSYSAMLRMLIPEVVILLEKAGNPEVEKIKSLKIKGTCGPSKCLSYWDHLYTIAFKDSGLLVEIEDYFYKCLEQKIQEELENFIQNIISLPQDFYGVQYQNLIALLKENLPISLLITFENIHNVIFLTEIIFRLNRLKKAVVLGPLNEIIFSKAGLDRARDDLFNEGALLLRHYLDSDFVSGSLDNKKSNRLLAELSQLSEILHCAEQTIKNPQKKVIRQKLYIKANTIQGKPSYWKFFLGSLLFLSGAILMGLSLAGIVHTGGISVLGLPLSQKVMTIGSSIILASGLLFFASGQRKAISKAVVNIADEAASLTHHANKR